MSTDDPDPLRSVLIDLLIERPDATSAELVEQLRQTDPMLGTATLTAAALSARQWVSGLGPLESLLTEPSVAEIMINGPGPVWVDAGGDVTRTGLVVTAQDLELLIERVLDPLGLRVDRAQPFVDARLPGGARVNVVIKPLAIDGPIVTIRRFEAEPVPLSAFGPRGVVDLLVDFVERRKTILIVGGTSTGKTTLVNALASSFASADRIITIEDTAELELRAAHLVRLEARPANTEGVGAVGLRALVRNAMRMRPDRLIVGEVRGPEAFDLLLALTTGHRGSLTTCHAGGAAAGLRRLEVLASMGAPTLRPQVIQSLVQEAIDVVVHLERTREGRAIAEVLSVGDTQASELIVEAGVGQVQVETRVLWP